MGRRSGAAGTRLTQRRTATYAERATSTRLVLSKKDRTAPAFFGFKLLLPLRRGQRSFQCPTREVVRRHLFPPLRGSFPVGCIKYYIEVCCVERTWWGAGLAGREHCMGSPASNGATCEHCMGSPASNGGRQRRWRGEHQGRKESCRPPNQDWVTPRERKAVIDPSPPVGVPPVLALPPLLLSLFPLPLLSAVPTPFVLLLPSATGRPLPASARSNCTTQN